MTRGRWEGSNLYHEFIFHLGNQQNQPQEIPAPVFFSKSEQQTWRNKSICAPLPNKQKHVPQSRGRPARGTCVRPHGVEILEVNKRARGSPTKRKKTDLEINS